MTFRKLVTTFVATTFVAAAQAHVHLAKSTPANNSRGKAPASIELTFSEAAYLTSVTLQKGEEAAKPLKLPTGGAAIAASVALPPLAAGDYLVVWRVESDDGHSTTGRIRFTVLGP